MCGKQTAFTLLRPGLKLSFLIKLIVGDGSGDPETSHSYAAIGPDCWGTSHDAPLSTLHVHVTLLLLLTCVSLSAGISGLVLWSLLSPLFCPLNPSWSRQMATFPGSGSDGGFFLLKGSFFSPQTPCARSGREIGSKRSFSAICRFL